MKNYNVADYLVCTAAFMAGAVWFAVMIMVVVGLW